MVYEVKREEVTQEQWDEMRKIARENVCGVCGAELQIHTNPEKGTLEVGCLNREHHGYVERTTWTQEFRRGEGAPLVIKDKIEKKMLPGGYEVGTALAIVKTRFPRADLDDPSAALFIMDAMRLDLDPLLGEIVPVTFKVTDKETKEVRRVVQPVLTEDGWLSLCSRACPGRWVGPPHTYRLEDYLRTLEENKAKPPDEIKELAREMKLDTCGDGAAYFWVAMGKTNVDGTILETAPAYGWLKQKDFKKAQEAHTPAGELPGNQARVRAIKRWVRENFPEAKSKMKEMTATWMERAGDVSDIQKVIEAEYHIVTETPPPSKPEGDEKSSEQASKKVGARAPTQSKQEATEAAEVAGEGFNIDLTWLKESQKALKWTDDTCKTFLVSQYKVSPQGTLEEVIQRLTREQAEDFTKQINDRVATSTRRLL